MKGSEINELAQDRHSWRVFTENAMYYKYAEQTSSSSSVHTRKKTYWT